MAENTRLHSHSDENQEYILKHSWFIYGLGIACLIVAIGMVLISTVASPWDDFGETIAFVVCLTFFTLAGIATILEAVKSSVVVNGEGIFCKAPWPWYPRKILWNEIKRVGYSGLAESFVIVTNTGRKTRISKYFNGINHLKYFFIQRLEPQMYQEVKSHF